MYQQQHRSNSFSERVRRLSSYTILRNTAKATARTVLTAHRRTSSDDRFGYVVYGASHSSANLSNQPPRDEWKRYRNKSRSTDDVVYRPRTQAQQRSNRPRPSVEDSTSHPKPKSHSRTLDMRYGPQDGPSRTRPGPPNMAGISNVAMPPGHPSSSRDVLRKKERPVPVPQPNYTQRRPEANVRAGGYQFPTRPESPSRDSELFRSFAPPPRSPAMSAAMPDSPTLGVLSHSFGGISAPPRGPHAPHRVGPSPLAKSPESVYCSTGTPTVRRHGAIRRTSSSGEATVPLPIQHARHRSDQKEQRATGSGSRHHTSRPSTAPTPREHDRPAPTLYRGPTQRLPPPPSPLRPTEPTRDPRARLPEVRPKARNVPRDVEDMDSLVGTETPRSSLMLIPPAPVATTSMVAKVQGAISMNMRESTSARPVKTVVAGGGDLHRARSYKAEVSRYPEPEVQGSPRSTEPESTVGAVVEGEGGLSGRRKGKETRRRLEQDAAEKRAGVAAWVNSISRPQEQQRDARSTSRSHATPTPQRAGTLPLNVRKKNATGMDANASRR
ncbi:hypothetical protein L227DRAFT_576381 [Lentinus tigrinus ALCF2SS1-6]|uniref:Uncharacterized protein n=1 Tax=Lentinus tigrinus ALCF2SS1-6 TaxID=1328759 RepID=A0A5C2S611_9APHY|nr:hypothetical protein L227DRAFT_576381 [Lentinus tigrinus ALCF2SS1-6]